MLHKPKKKLARAKVVARLLTHDLCGIYLCHSSRFCCYSLWMPMSRPPSALGAMTFVPLLSSSISSLEVYTESMYLEILKQLYQ